MSRRLARIMRGVSASVKRQEVIMIAGAGMFEKIITSENLAANNQRGGKVSGGNPDHLAPLPQVWQALAPRSCH